MDNTYTIQIKLKYLILVLFVIMLIIFLYFNKNKEKYTTNDTVFKNNFGGIVKPYFDLSGSTDISGGHVFNSFRTTVFDIQTFKGIIVAWSGTTDNIPSGWILCDGTNGTPDLRNRFIIGGSTDSTTTLTSKLTPKKINDISGNEKEILNDKQIPFHNHNIDWSPYGCVGWMCVTPPVFDWVGTSFFTGENMLFSKMSNPTLFPSTTDHVYGVTSSTPHENMPPYYSLAYIMKT